MAFTAEQRFVVTGASSGIGEAVALLLNACGATVITVARNEVRLEQMRAKAAAPERILVEVKDLAEDVSALPAYVKALREKYGKLQGMALCAGVGNNMPIRALEYEDMRKMFDVNLFAPVFLAKGFVDKRNNNGPGSALVSIASIGGMVCEKGHTSYAGSKAGLAASMKCIAREAAALGVRINCVSPSLIETPMISGNTAEYLDEARKTYPLGLGSVNDVAEMIVYLLSEKAKWITGQNYVIDCAKY